MPLSVKVGVENKLSDEHPDRDEDAVCVFWTKVCVAVFVLIGVDVAERDIVRVFRGDSEIVLVVKGVFVNPIEPVIVFDTRAVTVSRVVPECVVLADIVFDLEADPEKLLVPVDVLVEEILLV